VENNGLLVATSAKKFNYALVPGDHATSQQPHDRYRCSSPNDKSVMSASNKGSDPELFAEAPLPPPLELLVKELGVKMKPLVEAVKGQKSYSRVECPDGAQVIEKIYRQYNDLIVKESDPATQFLRRLGVNAYSPACLSILQKGTTALVPEDEYAIVIPTFIATPGISGGAPSLTVVIVEKGKETRYERTWKIGFSYCLLGKAGVDITDASKVGIILWKWSKKDISKK